MNLHSFHLTFDVSALGLSSDELIERLGAAGCTDALVGLGLAGVVRLDFLRRAPTLCAARASGLRDVLTALPAARPLD